MSLSDPLLGGRGASTPARPNPLTNRLLIPLLLATAGVAIVVGMVHQVGAGALLVVLGAAAPLLPLALTLEGARLACEAVSARTLYRRVAGRGGSVPPWSALLRVHFMTYAVVAFAPAGRAAGEAVRAAALRKHVGGARAAAVGTASQGLSLLATGLVSLPCALAAHLAGTGVLVASLLVQAAVLSLLGLLVLLGTRRPELARLLRRFRKTEQGGEAYVQAMNALPPVPLDALALAIFGRGVQALLLGTLLFAVGAPLTLRSALVALGAVTVGTSAGDFVPGQLGATDGALALFHSALGTTAARAVGAAMLAHLVQAGWALLSVAAPLFALKRARADLRGSFGRGGGSAPTGSIG